MTAVVGAVPFDCEGLTDSSPLRGQEEAMISLRSVFVLGAALMLAATVQAKDFCVQTDDSAIASPGSHTLFVGKHFSIPRSGKCKPWLGFTPNLHETPYPSGQQSGVACTASDGTHVTFSISTQIPTYGFALDVITLPLPSLT